MSQTETKKVWAKLVGFYYFILENPQVLKTMVHKLTDSKVPVLERYSPPSKGDCVLYLQLRHPLLWYRGSHHSVGIWEQPAPEMTNILKVNTYSY